MGAYDRYVSRIRSNFAERLVVEADVVDRLGRDARLLQAVIDGVDGEALVVLLAREALFLSGGDDLAILDQRGRAVVIVGRDAKDEGHGRQRGIRCTQRRLAISPPGSRCASWRRTRRRRTRRSIAGQRRVGFDAHRHLGERYRRGSWSRRSPPCHPATSSSCPGLPDTPSRPTYPPTAPDPLSHFDVHIVESFELERRGLVEVQVKRVARWAS